jgi:hypothetical protein
MEHVRSSIGKKASIIGIVQKEHCKEDSTTLTVESNRLLVDSETWERKEYTVYVAGSTRIEPAADVELNSIVKGDRVYVEGKWGNSNDIAASLVIVTKAEDVEKTAAKPFLLFGQ